MGSEKFCLRWNDFENNISCAFRELRDDKDFFDVTLACDDEQIQAHKMILSACSPFFRTILRRNPHPHPLLYLKGVKYTDLQSVLNFMYHGEVNVAQEELNSFLTVAEDLQVKGLTQTNTANTHKKRNYSQPKSTTHRNPHPTHHLQHNSCLNTNLPKNPTTKHKPTQLLLLFSPHPLDKSWMTISKLNSLSRRNQETTLLHLYIQVLMQMFILPKIFTLLAASHLPVWKMMAMVTKMTSMQSMNSTRMDRCMVLLRWTILTLL